jgi:hypothetical protein
MSFPWENSVTAIIPQPKKRRIGSVEALYDDVLNHFPTTHDLELQKNNIQSVLLKSIDTNQYQESKKRKYLQTYWCGLLDRSRQRPTTTKTTTFNEVVVTNIQTIKEENPNQTQNEVIYGITLEQENS